MKFHQRKHWNRKRHSWWKQEQVNFSLNKEWSVIFGYHFYSQASNNQSMLMNTRKIRENHSKQQSEINPALQALRGSLPSDHRSYFTTRHREQDDCSVCPSIEKEMVDHLNGENMSQLQIEQLLEQSRLKDQALEKASSMIRLLEEENEELLSQVGYLDTLLKDQQRQVEALEQELKRYRPNDSHILIKDLINEPQQILATNDFFSFSQNRLPQQPRKSMGKIINQDHPSFGDITADINISKKLTPFGSRQIIGQQTDEGGVSNILSNLSYLLVQEGVDSSRAAMEELQELLAAQEQQQEQLFMELQYCQQDTEADLSREFPHSPESSTVARRLFTLKDIGKESPPLDDLIGQFQRCIQGYKEYAAYLRAHLCECINFLGQQYGGSWKVTESGWTGGWLKMAAREIGKSARRQMEELQEENWELKRIMEEMIRNFEAAQGSTIRKRV